MIRICLTFILAVALTGGGPAAAQTAPSDSLITMSSHNAPKASALFSAMTSGSQQRAEAIGSYARGCLAGGVQLPETGPTWQAMRLSRNRNWGHPTLIAFIERFSAEAARLGWAGLYIGDMSQPRGGPTPSSHRSHQVGLDVDIWLSAPTRMDLSRRARETISAISVRSADQRSVNANWTATHMAVIRAAAMDPDVERIFITAPAKIAMCRDATGDRRWLQKIRPLYGHEDHIHVRLRCPRGSRHCQHQTPTVAQLSNGGDGCDASLQWWVTTYLDRHRPSTKPAKPAKPTPARRHPRDYTMAELPARCTGVLESD